VTVLFRVNRLLKMPLRPDRNGMPPTHRGPRDGDYSLFSDASSISDVKVSELSPQPQGTVSVRITSQLIIQSLSERFSSGQLHMEILPQYGWRIT
jgi:hypothetical protein